MRSSLLRSLHCLLCTSNRTHAKWVRARLQMTAKMGERDSREEILKAFRLFDDDGSGTITLKDLRRVAKELGENLTGGVVRGGGGKGYAERSAPPSCKPC